MGGEQAPAAGGEGQEVAQGDGAEAAAQRESERDGAELDDGLVEGPGQGHLRVVVQDDARQPRLEPVVDRPERRRHAHRMATAAGVATAAANATAIATSGTAIAIAAAAAAATIATAIATASAIATAATASVLLSHGRSEHRGLEGEHGVHGEEVEVREPPRHAIHVVGRRTAPAQQFGGALTDQCVMNE